MKELASIVETNLKIKRSIIFGQEKNKIIKKIISILFLLIAFTGAVELLIIKAFNLLHSSSNELLIFNFIVNFELIMLTIITFFTILNKGFLGSDYKEMIIYPIKSGNLILSKCILCYIDNIILSIFALIPLLSYGVLNNETYYYYINLILYQIVIAAIPVIYIFILFLTIFWIITLISKSKIKYKHNSFLIVVDLLVGILTYMLLKSSLSNNINNLLLNTFFSTNNVSLVLPINNQIIINFLIIIGIIISSFLGFYFIGGNVYLTIMKSELFNSKDSKEIENCTSQYKFKSRNIVISNIIRELKLIIRTPVLEISCIYASLIFSVYYIALILSSKNFLINFGNNMEGMKCIFISFLMFLVTLSNQTFSISFSREGRFLNQLKVFPIDSKKLLFSKICLGILTNLVSLISVNILIVFLSSDFKEYILLLIVEIIQMLVISISHIQIDLSNMELTWVKIRDLSNNKMFKIMPSFFLITTLLILYGVIIKSLLNIRVTELFSFTFLILINGVYSFYFFKKLKTSMKQENF